MEIHLHPGVYKTVIPVNLHKVRSELVMWKELKVTNKNEFKQSLLSYLDIPLYDLPTHQHTPLRQVNPRQRDQGLPDDLIAGEPIEAQDHEVKGQLWHPGQWDAVEAESLIKGGVQSLPQYSSLHPVLFLWQ